MLRLVLRSLLWFAAACVSVSLAFVALILWPDPLFAFSARDGLIIVKSDQPIPTEGVNRVLSDCEALLAQSPLKAEPHPYRIYVANTNWRQRLFFLVNRDAHGLAYPGGSVFLSGADFVTGRLNHHGYMPPRPRSLAYYCAHELTHEIAAEHYDTWRHRPAWVWEGFADYVGIEPRQSFEDLRNDLGDGPVDIPMMVRHGGYPRDRLLVTYFIEKKGWSVDQLFNTGLTEDEANAMMRTGGG